MKKLSAKTKILILCSVWLILSFLVFMYGFKILDDANQKTLAAMSDDRKNLANLNSENLGFKQAKADLQKMTGEAEQPKDFFSEDISLVKEIQVLEDLSKKYGVLMQLSGVAGTIDSLPLAATQTALAVVPYGISLNGDLGQIVNFTENFENLGFITNIRSLSISSGGEKGSVNVNFSANFYLRK